MYLISTHATADRPHSCRHPQEVWIKYRGHETANTAGLTPIEYNTEAVRDETILALAVL